MHRKRTIGLIALILFGLLPVTARAGDPEMPYPLSRPPRVGEIVHIPTGTLVDQRQMLNVVTEARIVYIGETHDNPASHRLELTVLRAMAERHPGRVALGMEMFTPAQQQTLDRWVAGEISEKEFLKTSRWYDVWNMDFAYYQSLLQFARERNIPVIGLNAEKSLVEAVRKNPLADLLPRQKAQLPEMNMEDPYQQAMTKAIFGGHTHQGDIDAFLRVQTLWDETMAQNTASYLATPEHGEMRMMVVAGGGHIRYGFGIPRRVFRRLPLSYYLVGSREIEIPPDKQDRLMDIESPSFPMPPYDFLVYTEYEDLGKQEVRLGALLEVDGKGVQIKAVLHGSAAAAAGLQAGDRILKFDGQDLGENFDLIYAIKQKTTEDRAVLLIDRQSRQLTLTVIFSEAESKHPPAKDKAPQSPPPQP